MANYCIIEGDIGEAKISPLTFTFIKVPYSLEQQIHILNNSDMPNKEIAMTEIKTRIYQKR